MEAFLSGPSLEREYATTTGHHLPAADIVAGATAHDPDAVEVLAIYEERLARALSSVINLLDPDVIVLGGGMSRTQQLYEGVPKLWGRWVFSDRVDTRLLPPVHGDSSGVRGAAWLWGRDGG
jgi:fructokinase